MNKNVPLQLPVSGVDLLSHETALSRNSVRYAMNVDINRNGGFQLRRGQVRHAAAADLHSLFYAPQKGWTLLAEGITLNRLNTDTYAKTPLYTLNSADPLSYVEYNGNLYFTNRTSLGWVPSTGVSAERVGVPVPDAVELSAGPGTLTAGKYAVQITLVNARGEEGGASPVRFIELPEGGGIRIANLPILAGHTVYVYLSEPDGDWLEWAEELPSGIFPTYVVGQPATGGKLGTQGLEPMPPGEFICWHNGRLFTAKNGAVRFSEAGWPHLHNPAHGVIPFSGHISFIASVGDGMYVGDSRGVWFLSGNDPVKFSQKMVSTCRAVKGSSVMVPPEHFPPKMVMATEPVAVWLSTSGYVVGMQGGATVELQPHRVKVPAQLSGRSIYLFRNGRKQIVTPVNSTATAAPGIAVDSVL